VANLALCLALSANVESVKGKNCTSIKLVLSLSAEEKVLNLCQSSISDLVLFPTLLVPT
jgi:hypothetical protein